MQSQPATKLPVSPGGTSGTTAQFPFDVEQFRQEVLQKTQEQIGLFYQGVRLLASDARLETCPHCHTPAEAYNFCMYCGFPLSISAFVRLFARHVSSS